MLNHLLISFLLFLFPITTLSSPIPPSNGIKFMKRGTFSSYEQDKIRGVNLGGWFVLEPYITPSLFEAFGSDESSIPVDEYEYTQYLGKEEALERLEEHWSTWIVEEDFEKMSELGLNLVRIPIGYWAFALLDDDPYVQGQEEYLDKALSWARNHNIKVWIDLHGAPGSQNGFDNSGLRDHLEFQTDSNVEVTLTVLQHIFDKYGGSNYHDVIVGIELLNEPLGPNLDMNKLNDFWRWGYENLRSTGSVQNVIIHDAFMPANYFDDKFLLDDYWHVVIDHHHYQVFSTGELSRSIDDHVSVACGWGDEAASEYHWNVCGEWSAALTDCTKWLNGVGRGARWEAAYQSDQWFGTCDGSQDYDTWDNTKKVNVRKYIEAQLDAFERTEGWIFWCWKTEASLDWDFRRLTMYGLFPSPLTDRWYGNQCNL